MSNILKLLVISRGEGTENDPSTPSPTPTPLPSDIGGLVENTDYGVVKVQGGKLVLDMQDFDADLGRF